MSVLRLSTKGDWLATKGILQMMATRAFSFPKGLVIDAISNPAARPDYCEPIRRPSGFSGARRPVGLRERQFIDDFDCKHAPLSRQMRRM